MPAQPRQHPTPLKLRLDAAGALIAQGRPEEALEVTAPLARDLVSTNALGLHATALKALGRGEEALSWDRKAVARFPGSAVAWHNLAATLGDLGQGADGRAAAERAFSLGLDAPQTWLVYARALAAIGEVEPAERAFRETMARAPGDPAPVLELAELLWTAHADLAGALAILDGAHAAGLNTAPLVLKEAGLLSAAGQADAALQRLRDAVRAQPAEPGLAIALSDALVKQARPEEALAALASAVASHPFHPAVLSQLSWAQTAVGQGEAALATARAGLLHDPLDQSLLNAEATAARLVGDPAYARLYDFEAFVAEIEIPAPDGWPGLAAYLADLAEALGRLHRQQGHPSDQSLQGGSQTTFRLTGSPEPAIQAFFRTIAAPLRSYMARLGSAADPFRRRNTGDYRLAGAWSVQLRSGHFHRDHFHSQGWISSAFYVETPHAALAREGREGWLRLGQPPFATATAMPAERYIRPSPGKLVLFPSYMWHGTEPFTTRENRTTIAFDVVPA
jgi:tetratricopeptide (TPR) repeat protein